MASFQTAIWDLPSQTWSYLGKGQNFATFSCPERGLVVKFIIRKEGYQDYLERRETFLQLIFSLFPQLESFSGDYFLSCELNQQKGVESLSSNLKTLINEKKISVTNSGKLAVSNDLTKKVCLKLMGVHEESCLSKRIVEQFDAANELSPVLAIELKPKSGLVYPDSEFVELRTTCRHKLIQISRLISDGFEVSEKYIYDPTQLFSNDFDLQVNCVQNMIQTSSKYLKVFGNGSLLSRSGTEIFLKTFSTLSEKDLAGLVVSTLRNCGILSVLSKCHILGLLPPEKTKNLMDQFGMKPEDVEFSSSTRDKYLNLISKLRERNVGSFSELTDFAAECGPEDYVILSLIGYSLIDASIFLSFVTEETATQ